MNLKPFTTVLIAAAALSFATAGHAEWISISPGSGPAGGYLPLASFGITPISGMANDSFAMFDIPSVGFARESWTRINVSENGFVTFGTADASSSLWTAANASLPQSDFETALLAPFWADIDVGSGGIYAGELSNGVDRWVVIDWANVTVDGSATASSFQLWLTVGADDVTFSYGQMSQTGNFTIGAQDSSGTVGTSYLYNSGSIANAELLVQTQSVPVPSIPEPASWAMMMLGMGLAGGALRRRETCIRFA